MAYQETHRLGRTIVIKELKKLGINIPPHLEYATKGPMNLEGQNSVTLLIKASRAAHQPNRWNVGKRQKPNESMYYVLVNVDEKKKIASKLLVVPSRYVDRNVKNWENPRAYIHFSDFNEEFKFLNNWQPVLTKLGL